MSVRPGILDPARIPHGPAAERPPEVYVSDAAYQLEHGGADAAELLAWRRPSLGAWLTLALTGILALLGLAAFIYLVAGGQEPRVKWGYTAAMLAFLITAAQSGPILSTLMRLTHAYWASSLRRAADLLALAGIVTTPVYMVLLFQLPEFQDRPSLWFNWPATPVVTDCVLIVTLALGGLGIIWTGAVPDLAAAGSWLAFGWRGTPRQWLLIQRSLVIQGSLYITVYLVMNWFVATDLGGSLIPGWNSKNTPVYMSFTGFEAGLAMVILALGGMRFLGGLERFFEKDVYVHLAKLLFGFGLLFMWFLWSELLVWWYGRTNEEKMLEALLYYGPYLVPFAIAIGLNFAAPLLLLMWIQLRESFWAPTLVAALVLLGTYVDRVRFFVAAWSVAGPVKGTLDAIPPTHFPNVLDVLILVGGPCGFVFLYLLALRLLPPVGVWEHREDLLYRIHRPYLRTNVKVVAKQD